MKNDKASVQFIASNGRAANCICTACHGTGIVTMLKLPKTHYADGMYLTTEYSNYWLCQACKNKLIKALLNGSTAPEKEAGR